MVVFSLAGVETAVGIRQVREIIRVGEITMMPKAPEFLEGIINLRGKIIPVLDLRKRFRMPLIDRTEETRILIIEVKDQMLGFLVDKVAGVLRVSKDMMTAPTEPVLTIGTEYMEGLVMLEKRLILVLNLDMLLNFDELKALPDWETQPHREA